MRICRTFSAFSQKPPELKFDAKVEFRLALTRGEKIELLQPPGTVESGWFYTIWPMHRERILAKNLFAFNQASSSTFPAAENTGNKERNERRKKK